MMESYRLPQVDKIYFNIWFTINCRREVEVIASCHIWETLEKRY